jgi:hypothetical protein
LQTSWAELADDLRVALLAAEVEPVFSPLGDERYADGVETIYEGYLAHYGTPRAFRPADGDEALLLGDSLYAAGLARIAAAGTADAVADVSLLLARCSELRADGRDGDGGVWAASIALLGAHPLSREGEPEALAREVAGPVAVDRALAAHAERFR